MKFERIRLQNFKCYEDADLRLDSGVTVIHGLNGSGKSSLLEACFFALYGSSALDSTLDEIVTIGAEETIVELWFTHAGESYHIRRRLRANDGDARTAECVLEGPGGTTEGATDVRARITSLLRMDTEAFVNCAYVRQGEVNKLINASPSVRQDMLDDLLQLGKLESYRERASDARVGIGRVRDDKQGALSEVEEQLDAKESQKLYEQRNSLKTELSTVSDDIDRYEENRAEAEQSREDAIAVIEEYEDKRETLASVEDDIEQLRTRIQETEREREELAARASECQEELTDVRDRRSEILETVELSTDEIEDISVEISARIETLQEQSEALTEKIRELSVAKSTHDNEAEQLAERASELEETVTEKREKANELTESLADSRDLIESRREKLSEMHDSKEEKRNTFADSPVEFGKATDHREDIAEKLTAVRERQTELAVELENERERLAEAKSLLEAGNCPECGQPVEESPHVTGIDERAERIEALEDEHTEIAEREETLETKLEEAKSLVETESVVETLETERENLSQLLEERETTLTEKETRIEQLREEATDHEEEAESKRETREAKLEAARECQQEIAECNQQAAEYKKRRKTLETLAETIDEIATLEDELETVRNQRKEKGAINDERREQLTEKRETRAELAETVEDRKLEQARTQKQKASAYLEKVTEMLAELEEKQQSLQGRLGAVENEIAAMGDLRERQATLRETAENLDSLYSEAEQLEEMYRTLRAELRQRNIESLERMLNETFELVYENDTYSHIEIDGEYRLTVYQKDGAELDPEQLSGGERALFNLSLRCAIYQLLAEGIEGTAPMPPLILDEPTVFLDSGHVSQLVELIGAMYDLGVEQILVVSHDEELVSAADDLITVRKNPTTNRSSVERAETVDTEQLAMADS